MGILILIILFRGGISIMNWIYYIEYNFIIYSFIGWIIEEVYSYIIVGRFKEDGFLIGPIKPMYGIAMAIIICLFKIYDMGLIEKMIIAFIVPALVEYVSGYGLKKIFNKVYWSYEGLKYNINGFVCLRFCFYWFVLILFVTKFIVPITDYIFNKYQLLVSILVPLITAIVFIDFLYTLKNFFVVQK